MHDLRHMAHCCCCGDIVRRLELIQYTLHASACAPNAKYDEWCTNGQVNYKRDTMIELTKFFFSLEISVVNSLNDGRVTSKDMVDIITSFDTTNIDSLFEVNNNNNRMYRRVKTLNGWMERRNEERNWTIFAYRIMLSEHFHFIFSSHTVDVWRANIPHENSIYFPMTLMLHSHSFIRIPLSSFTFIAVARRLQSINSFNFVSN